MFTDRLLVALIWLCHRLPHAALAELYGVDRLQGPGGGAGDTALLAARGFALPDRPGIRIHTLEDLFTYAGAENIELRIDGTETQVRRSQAHRPVRKVFVSGKTKQNMMKTISFSDAEERALFSGVVRPGRMHDRTAERGGGIAEQFRLRPQIKAEADDGYRGLAGEFPDQISAPPKKPGRRGCL
ncbi:transposase family protein [Streptomyces sp. NPDC050617]|uniref:transposase family protein n=1 Tax=Streptomyces sp. NPDC050617 TaxID=3154628 RepID=UPI0034409C04